MEQPRSFKKVYTFFLYVYIGVAIFTWQSGEVIRSVGKKLRCCFGRDRGPSVNQGHVARVASGHDIEGVCEYLQPKTLMD